MVVDTARGLGGRFVAATLLLLVLVAALVAWGDRLPATAADDPSVVAVVLLVVFLLLATYLIRVPLVALWPTRSGGPRPFAPCPELEASLSDVIEAYRTDLESYKTHLTALGDTHPSNVALKRAESELERADNKRVDSEYIAALRYYYKSQRRLVEIAPGLNQAGTSAKQTRDRLAELVDQCRQAATGMDDRTARRAVEQSLDEFESARAKATAQGTAIDVSPLYAAFRRVHAAQLQTVSYYLQLRTLLRRMSGLMTIVIVVVTLGALAGAVAAVLDVDWFDRLVVALIGPEYDSFPLVYVPAAFGFGAVGAVLNILRRFGSSALFTETPTFRELPDDIIMGPSLRTRILWGSIAAFVVVVFIASSLDGTLTPVFIVLTAVLAGFSEQLLEKVLAQHQERIPEENSEEATTADGTAGALWGVSYDGRGRVVIHGISEEAAEELRERYESTVHDVFDRRRCRADKTGAGGEQSAAGSSPDSHDRHSTGVDRESGGQ